jgi:hypothetical protein
MRNLEPLLSPRHDELLAQTSPDQITQCIELSRRRLRPIGITEDEFKALLRQSSHTKQQHIDAEVA